MIKNKLNKSGGSYARDERLASSPPNYCEDGDQWAHIEEVKHPEGTPINEDFEKGFAQYREENPDWAECLTDSTYFELMDWYDYTHGINNEECNSDEARRFANYVWYTYIEKPKSPKHVFTLKGEVCDFPTGGDDYELYLKYDNREMDPILDQICDIVNENYPDDEERFNVTIQLTIDKENEDTNN